MDYTNASDTQLLTLTRQGDIRAYNEFFRRYAPQLYRQACRYIKNEEVAEELMLDILFDIWDKRSIRDITGEIGAYLYRCMRNKIVDYRRQHIPEFVTIDKVEHIRPLSTPQMGDYLTMTKDAEHVYFNALQAMSPQRRQVFRLSREEQLTYSEIAKEMNLSINTVENYMATALEIFRSRAKDYLTLISLFILSLFL